jgi:glucose-6-phosphate 1-epimerase
MSLENHALAGEVARLTYGADHAIVALDGAHVVAWRHGGRDMLWCAATRPEGKPLRGGIPVCWPWFGSHPDDLSRPSHGVARLRTWTIVEQSAARIVMTLSEGTLSARLEVELGDNLRVSLTTGNNGTVPVAVSAALHTYLAVDDIGNVRVIGLDGATYADKLDGFARKVQQGNLQFTGETDRIYATAGPVRMTEGARCVEVDGAGTSGSTVVWNPWVETSARLGDMAPDDYRRMLCLETAWAGDDARTLAPGASATLTTVLRPQLITPRGGTPIVIMTATHRS